MSNGRCHDNHNSDKANCWFSLSALHKAKSSSSSINFPWNLYGSLFRHDNRNPSDLSNLGRLSFVAVSVFLLSYGCLSQNRIPHSPFFRTCTATICCLLSLFYTLPWHCFCLVADEQPFKITAAVYTFNIFCNCSEGHIF